MVSFSSKLEQSLVLKKCQKFSHLNVKKFLRYVKKWLTREKKIINNTLRKICKTLSDYHDAMANGKKSFIIINGHV